jgi:hypothetical protein
MAEGLSRRDLIKGAAVAGAAAWTAPVILGSLTSSAGAQTTTSCSLQKIPSCSSVNGGNIPFCSGLTSVSADFSTCISPQCDTYSPSTGFLFKVCGPVATSGIAQVKWGGNAAGCSDSSLNGSGCSEASFSGGAGTFQHFTGCTAGSRASGNVFEWGAVGAAFTSSDGSITRSGVAGARWLLIWPPATVNLIGLGVCFTFGSIPPSCAAGSCV